MSDPIFPDKLPVPPAPGQTEPQKHIHSDTDWVVVHRGGENSKAHVEALERKLTHAHIPSLVQHDDDHRVVLEVHRDRESDAVAVLGAGNVSGQGEQVHQTKEERMQAGERAELKGPFKAATVRWVLVVVAVALLVYLVYVFTH